MTHCLLLLPSMEATGSKSPSDLQKARLYFCFLFASISQTKTGKTADRVRKPQDVPAVRWTSNQRHRLDSEPVRFFHPPWSMAQPLVNPPSPPPPVSTSCSRLPVFTCFTLTSVKTLYERVKQEADMSSPPGCFLWPRRAGNKPN